MFQYYLAMSIGSDHIALNQITQSYILNRSLKINYDQAQPKGKDTKKYLSVMVDQFFRKKKTGVTSKAANAAKGVVGQKKASEAVYYQLETGKKDS